MLSVILAIFPPFNLDKLDCITFESFKITLCIGRCLPILCMYFLVNLEVEYFIKKSFTPGVPIKAKRYSFIFRFPSSVTPPVSLIYLSFNILTEFLKYSTIPNGCGI